MAKCGVLSEVRPEFLNNILTSLGFKDLKIMHIQFLSESLTELLNIAIFRNFWVMLGQTLICAMSYICNLFILLLLNLM
jgi:hypothetical protein